MGRRKIELDYKVVDTALYYGATMKQLQFLLEKNGIPLDCKTIERRIKADKGMIFSEYREKHREGLKLKMIQKAVEMAFSGNSTMMIFCLKNICKWTDVQQVDNNSQVNVNYKIVKK